MRIRISRAVAGDEIQVPTSPFALVSGVTSLLTTLVTILTFSLVTKPAADQARAIEMNKNRTEMLQRALQVETADGRRNSLRLLVGLGMIGEDRTSEIDGFLTRQTDTLPLWRSIPSGRGGISQLPVRDSVSNSTTGARR